MKKISFFGANLIYILCTIVLYKMNNTSWLLLFRDIKTGFADAGRREYFFLCGILCLTLIIMICVYLIAVKKVVFRIKVELLKKHKKFVIGKFDWIRLNGMWICVAIFLVSMLCTYYCGVFRVVKGSQWGEPLTVAHAGGRIDGNDYSNSVDAILENYDKGQRVFEIDFCVTTDNRLIGKHDWGFVIQDNMVENQPVSEEEFLKEPIYREYEPLSFEKLCYMLKEYQDMWIVTDTKDKEANLVKNEFQIMRATAEELSLESVLDRVVVQVYDENMYDVISKIYPFKEYIFTLYQFFGGDSDTFLSCARYSYSKGIKNMATWNYMVNEELIEIANRYNIHLYAHTEDDYKNAKKMIDDGLTGIYTNIILPKEIAEE